MKALRYLIKKYFARWLFSQQIAASKKNELQRLVEQYRTKSVAKLSDASYDVFTYHGEDGIILYLLSRLKDIQSTFVDIGSGDCIKSNCANLAVHFGWRGVFIDKDDRMLEIGRRFYRRLKKIKNNHLRFVNAEISPENADTLISSNRVGGEIGLLSIDIDGNDYWVWKAIGVIQPSIVVIEAKVEFGFRDLIVPPGEQNHHSCNPQYNGASVEALRKLGLKKGYRLVGANHYGYNLFFIRKEKTVLKPALTEDVLFNPATIKSFYPESFFVNKKFVTEV